MSYSIKKVLISSLLLILLVSFVVIGCDNDKPTPGNEDDFFDESDVLTDDDEFKPGFLYEDDDEFFKNLDEERVDHYNEFEKRQVINVVSNNQLPNQVVKIEINPDGSVKRVYREFKE